MISSHEYVWHGPRLRGADFLSFVDHIYEGNLRRMKAGQDSVPCCIWGKHGIGKTQSMREYARRRGVGFRQINPAQFEEMGDITGMPRVHDPSTPHDPSDDVTHYAMPDWAQDMHRQGPEGILLLDDFNRADNRIIRGLMQLLQDRQMVSWKLPPHWQIFLTANPDGGDYSVTPVDDAVLTRMSHVTLEFDHRAWAAWARSAEIDERGIAFVVGYPELIGDGRTTARSLVNLFMHLRPIDDLAGNLNLVDALARSCIDDATADVFVTFVRHSLSSIPDAQEILEAQDLVGTVIPKLQRAESGDSSGKRRADIRNIVTDRVAHAIIASRGQLSDRARGNARDFLAHEWLPADLRFAALTQLSGVRWADFLFSDRRLEVAFRAGVVGAGAGA